MSDKVSVAGFFAIAAAGTAHAAPPIKSPPLAAFVHTVVTGTGGNLCSADGSSTRLDHPLANGNPNAVIVATHNGGATGGSGGISTVPGVLLAYYDDAGVCGTAGRWYVNNENPDHSNFLGGEKLNVIVAAP